MPRRLALLLALLAGCTGSSAAPPAGAPAMPPARVDAVTAAAGAVKASEAAAVAARLDLEFTSITAPIDGRAGRRLVDVGNVVSPQETRSLLSIQRLDPIYAEFSVTEADLVRLRSSLA